MPNTKSNTENPPPKGEIIIYEAADGQARLEVRYADETVWLTQQQIGLLFDTARTNVVEHIKHIYGEAELDAGATCRNFRQVQTEGKRQVSRQIPFYNLDLILSVGYRVNSKRATRFRRWATAVLRQHLLQGYTVNPSRLTQLNKAIEIISRSGSPEIAGIAAVLAQFAGGLRLLDDYDHKTLAKPKGAASAWQLTYDEARRLIDAMRLSQESTLFGKEKDASFQSALATIYQTFDGMALYPGVQEQAANLLYLVVKNHAFCDGNKRIAAALFVYFLDKNKALRNENGQALVSNSALAAITLMIALSHPEEKETMCLMVMNMITVAAN